MSNQSIVHSTRDAFGNDVLASEVPVLVDFWAPWCGPCRAIAPHLETLADRYEGRARVVKLDIDQHPEIASNYGVRGIPTLLVFKGGEVVDKLVGNPGAVGPLDSLIARNL